MKNITLTTADMLAVLQGNPLAMEQAKVASLQREYADLEARFEKLAATLAEIKAGQNGKVGETIPASA